MEEKGDLSNLKYGLVVSARVFQKMFNLPGFYYTTICQFYKKSGPENDTISKDQQWHWEKSFVESSSTLSNPFLQLRHAEN